MTEPPLIDDPLIHIDLGDHDPIQLRAWLAQMLLIREFDTQADALAVRGKIPGGIHTSMGQEAVGVGALAALAPNDIVASTHRSHHHALSRGLSPRETMAELYGKSTGCRRGRGGTMHLADFSVGYYGGNGIVGAGVGIAMGAALAAKMRGLDQVAVGFVGDAGVNTGRTWESVNMAAVWTLPLVVICENNQYGVQTPIARTTGGQSIVRRAQGFGLPAELVDGQDVLAVFQAVAAATERARSGGGPSFIEALTYRYEGHNTGEVVNYRTTDEVELWRSTKDPIERLRRALKIGDVELADMQATAAATVADAVEFAETSPFPETYVATDDVMGMHVVAKENV